MNRRRGLSQAAVPYLHGRQQRSFLEATARVLVGGAKYEVRGAVPNP